MRLHLATAYHHSDSLPTVALRLYGNVVQMVLLCLGLLGMFVTPHALGDVKSSPMTSLQGDTLQNEIMQGFVLNQTVSPRAQEFVRRFEQQWRGRHVAALVNVQIQERPSARWGTQLSIVLADRVVYRTAIHQRTWDWDSLVAQATQRVASQARMGLRAKGLSDNPDLAPNEF